MVGALVVLAFLAACGGEGDGHGATTSAPTRRLPTLPIVVRDAPDTGTGVRRYAYDIPRVVVPGPTRLALANHSRVSHHAQLFRLRPGVTITQLRAALATGNPAAALPYGSFEGGPALVAPGETSHANPIVDLVPGRYAFICFVADGKVPHFMEGMLHEFDVRGPRRGGTSSTASVAVEMVDYSFDLPASVPHDAVLAVHNRSKAEPHEMIVARVEAGATTRSVIDALTSGRTAPITEVGGVQALLPAGAQRVQLSLRPGNYVVFCEIPSMSDGRAHVMKGMIRPLQVR